MDFIKLQRQEYELWDNEKLYIYIMSYEVCEYKGNEYVGYGISERV